ncbi:recombinase, partial [Acinetobacter oleivorans]|nr:recombinase [Acinetobacter oleivorans]
MHVNFSEHFLKIEKQLEDPQAVIDENLLIELVNVVRPSDPEDTDEIKNKIQALIESLLRTPTAPFLLQTFLLRLINRY